ncbi:cytochrome c [bacterium]|nr:cytochrome c [bacterium]
MLKIAFRLVLAASTLLVVGYGGVYGLSNRILSSHGDPVPFLMDIPTDSASIAAGGHIAVTRGCMGCHGQQLEGEDHSADWPWIGTPVAPNLPKYVRTHGPAVTEAAIRQGIGHDGKALFSMPSYNFTYLSDVDVASLIAFIQASPVVEHALPEPKLNLQSRWTLITGYELDAVGWVESLPEFISFEEGSALARGQYLAMTTCIECHGLDLRGTSWGTPDLSIASAYSIDGFRRLMKEGIGLGEREDLGLMTQVAKGRFTHFSEGEVEDVFAFLQTLKDQPKAEGVFWREEE